MEKRVVWVPVKAFVRIEVEVESGLGKKGIFEAAVEKAYETDGLHRLPLGDFMVDDVEVQGRGIEYMIEELVEDMLH